MSARPSRRSEPEMRALMRSWLAADVAGLPDGADLPPGVRATVLSRLPGTPQRRRWWPFAWFPRPTGATRDADGQGPHPDGRSKNMFGTVRIAAVVAVLALGGSLAMASLSLGPPSTPPGAPAVEAPSPSPEPAPRDGLPTPVTGTARLEGSSTNVIAVVDGDEMRFGLDLPSSETMDDARVTGTGRYLLTIYGVPSNGAVAGTLRIENADGAWEGPVTGVLQPSGSTFGAGWLRGEGAYEGLSYYHHHQAVDTEAVLTVNGTIVAEIHPTSPSAGTRPGHQAPASPNGLVGASCRGGYRDRSARHALRTGSRPMAIRSAARSVVRGTSGDLHVLARGMVAAADGAEPVEGGHAKAGGRVGIRRPAGGSVTQLEAEPGCQADRMAHQPLRGGQLLHGPVARRQLQGRGRVRHRGGGSHDGDGCLGGLQRGAPGGPHVQHDLRLGGHDVRPRATADDPGVDRDVRPPPVEGVQGHDLVGRLKDGAAALLRLYAGVGGAPVDGQADVHESLARRDDVAVGTGTLEHEGHVGRFGRSRMTGELTGDPILLVRVGHEHEAPHRQPRRDVGQRALALLGRDLAERSHRVEPGQESGLHVAHAGAAGTLATDRRRAARRPSQARRRCPGGR